MAILTKYITADEFREYTGIDLYEELKTNSNPSDEVNAFLKRIEVRMESFLNATFFKNVTDEYPEFSDYQKQHYKYALLEQAYYVFKNGDISTDSGYDPDKGIIISKHAKREVTLAPNAIDHLRLIGFWTGHINKKGLLRPWIF